MVMGGKSIGGGSGIGSISGGNCRCNSCGVGGLLQTLMHPQCSNMYLLNCRSVGDVLICCGIVETNAKITQVWREITKSERKEIKRVFLFARNSLSLWNYILKCFLLHST
jgi:hypothetical protein